MIDLKKSLIKNSERISLIIVQTRKQVQIEVNKKKPIENVKSSRYIGCR